MSTENMIKAFTPAGEPASSVAVPAVFTGRGNSHAVYLAVRRQLADRRTGTHMSKTRGEVSGGGRKPWKQKHTGRARQGSIRAPQWRHGAVVFGPRPRKYTQSLPAKVRTLAMRTVMAGKIREGRVVIINAIEGAGKTRDAVKLIRKVGADRTAVVVIPAENAALRQAIRNIAGVRVEPVNALSVYDVIKYSHVILVGDSLAALVKRCGGEA